MKLQIDLNGSVTSFDMLEKCRNKMKENNIEECVIAEFTKKSVNSNYVGFINVIKEYFDLTNER